MKRKLSICLILLLLITCLSACGGSDSGNTDVTKAPELSEQDNTDNNSVEPQENSDSDSSGELQEIKDLEDSEDAETDEESDVSEDSAVDGSSGNPVEMSVHFIDVGQGDSTLIICGDEAMLIDAGPDKSGTAVQYYLKKQGVEKLKYVVITHPDTDHIGGMDVILTKFDCDNVFMPDVPEMPDTSAVRDMLYALDYKGYTAGMPELYVDYSLGSAVVTFLGPTEIASTENNNSIVTRITNGETSFLFTGDAESYEENLLNPESLGSDVYQVGHHGSESSTSEAFLDAVSPAFAVISCSSDGGYGHPHEAVLNALKSRGISVFRTDEQSTVIATSDGSSIEWSTSPSETWAPGIIPLIPDPSVSEKDTDVPDRSNSGTSDDNSIDGDTDFEPTYILNTNSNKFHIPSCSSVNDMSEHNKLPVDWSREDVIDAGYSPCHRCKP